MQADKAILNAVKALLQAQQEFAVAVKNGLVSGKDSHIDDIGEYWVRLYFENERKFGQYANEKNAPYDIQLNTGINVLVKTITRWSATGYGDQIKPLCGSQWQLLAAVYLDKDLQAERIALVPLEKLMQHEPFVSNKISREEDGTKAYPRFQWWGWLDQYVVYRIND